MKKLNALLVLLLSVGCSAKTITPVDKPLYFVFATPLSTHTLWLKAKEGMEEACKELNIHCDWNGPTKISINEMNDAIQTAILKKADGIITQGVIHKSIIENGNQLGIPFVLVDSKVIGADPLATISKDFDEQAELLLQNIEAKLGKDMHLKIGIQVSELTFDLAVSQIEAVKKAFQKHPGKYEIIAISESKSDKLRSKNEWVKVFQQELGMNVALNLAGENAIGCVEAKEYTANKDKVLIYGVDDMSETIALIKDKKIQGSVVTSFYKYGYDAIKILYDKVKMGKESVENVPARILIVDANNVDTYKNELK